MLRRASFRLQIVIFVPLSICREGGGDVVSHHCQLFMRFYPIIGRYLNIVLILLNCSMTIRRLHDIGKSGWWLLTNIIIEAIGISLMLLGIGTTNIDALFGDIDTIIPLIKTAMGGGIAIFGMLIWFVSLAFSFIIFAFTTMDSQRELINMVNLRSM